MFFPTILTILKIIFLPQISNVLTPISPKILDGVRLPLPWEDRELMPQPTHELS